MRWGDGSEYMGTFHKGKLSGKGKYTWIDGKYFEGDWVDSLIEGSG